MITKIISGGQTGADQAALDAAIKLKIPHGGWLPKGRLTENGTLPDKYNLQEMPTDSYPARTEQNIIESDGTVIFSHGELTGGSKLTQELALLHKKPCLHIDLDATPAFIASAEIVCWADENKIKILNVAGSRASGDPEIYRDTFYVIEGVILLGLVDAKCGETIDDPLLKNLLEYLPISPKTVQDAVDTMMDGMSLKDKVLVANMSSEDLLRLYKMTSLHIKSIFRLNYENDELKRSCEVITGRPINNIDDIATVIIGFLFEKLRNTHKLRVVK